MALPGDRFIYVLLSISSLRRLFADYYAMDCFVMGETKLTLGHIAESHLWNLHSPTGERGGSVVECRTPEREVRGSKPTTAVLCPWGRHFTPRKYWLLTQEAMAPSRYDWKIVDWDVKPQHNQPTNHSPTEYSQPLIHADGFMSLLFSSLQ